MPAHRSTPLAMALTLTLALLTAPGSSYAGSPGGQGSTKGPPRSTSPSGSATSPLGATGQTSSGIPNTAPTSSAIRPSTGPSSTLPTIQELPAIAPLSPSLPTQFATGGTLPGGTPSGATVTPSSTSLSPSERAPSTPGGGGKGLADCMGFWDRGTHMTRQEWRRVCIRMMQENPSVLR